MNEKYSNPGKDKRKVRILEERVQILETQVKKLIGDKQGVEVEVAKTKTLDDLKLTELKALCDENGVDYTEFGNTKKPYIGALKAKGL